MKLTKNPLVKAVLLDLGGVVVEIDWRRVLGALQLEGSSHEKFLLEELTTWPIYDRYERDELTTESFQMAFREYLGNRSTHQEFLAAWNSLLVGPVKGIESLLERVRDRVPLYALTNSNRAHCEWLNEAFPVVRSFRKVFTSFELKARKPEASTFLRCADEMGFAPEEILFVDDSQVNVDAARSLGFHAERVLNSSKDLLALFEIYGVLVR